jgi:hypothetical protein
VERRLVDGRPRERQAVVAVAAGDGGGCRDPLLLSLWLMLLLPLLLLFVLLLLFRLH